MTYQEKFNELQKQFSKKFDLYEQFQKGVSLKKGSSNELIAAKADFEKVSYEFQAFLIMFKENNAAPEDEFGTTGERCDVAS